MFLFLYSFKLDFRWRSIVVLVLFVGAQQKSSAKNTVLHLPNERSLPDSGPELKFFDEVSTRGDFDPNVRAISNATGKERTLKRDKRYLLWINGGISKLVVGFLTPIETRDRVNWRTMNMAYNFQAQYVPLPSAQFIWGKFTRDLINRRRQFDADGMLEKDASRSFVYRAIEIYLNSRGKNGKECLLKAICEAAEHPIEPTGIFDQILHLILTPNKDETSPPHDDYVNARLAGEHGSDCGNMFSKCPHGDGLLDKISLLV